MHWLWHYPHWHYGSGTMALAFALWHYMALALALLALQHVYSRFTQESLTYDAAAGLSPAFLTAAYTI